MLSYGNGTDRDSNARVGTDPGPEELVHGQTGAGSDKPTVAELALNQVVAVYTVDEQPRIVTDLLQRTHQQH